MVWCEPAQRFIEARKNYTNRATKKQVSKVLPMGDGLWKPDPNVAEWEHRPGLTESGWTLKTLDAARAKTMAAAVKSQNDSYSEVLCRLAKIESAVIRLLDELGVES